MRKLLCKLFGHKWGYFPVNIATKGGWIVSIARCTRCGESSTQHYFDGYKSPFERTDDV